MIMVGHTVNKAKNVLSGKEGENDSFKISEVLPFWRDTKLLISRGKN